MDLEENGAGWVTSQSFIEHRHEIVSCRALQRCVAGRLVCHEYAVRWKGGHFNTRIVVFRHPLLLPERFERHRSCLLLVSEGLSDQLLQPRRLAGVVVDTDIIDNQRQWRLIGT
ncbi:hypothetical protein D3C76_1491530 [compost metagenome]